jgi:uncharacterized delta-60 repeat protein
LEAPELRKYYAAFRSKVVRFMEMLFVFGFLVLSDFPVLAAEPAVEWEKLLGGVHIDVASSIQQTNDGGYIVAGSSWSDDGDVSENHGDGDFWVVKLKKNGMIEWRKALGGSGRDEATSVQQTRDGGYIVAGYSNSRDGDVSRNRGKLDCWIVKLKPDSAIEWQRPFGGSGDDAACSVQQTDDGGYIVAGYSESYNGDVSENHGDWDALVVKLKEDGKTEWEKSLGGSGRDIARSVRQTSDGGYIIAGSSNSNDEDVSGNHGKWDFWVVKLKNGGAIEWQNSLGGSEDDVAFSVQQTNDGGYIVAGHTGSEDGDVSGNHGRWDFWIVKLKKDGTTDWQRSVGGPGHDRAYSVWQTKDGGYIVAGAAPKRDGGDTDFWIVKLKTDGTADWEKSMGGSHFDKACSVQQTKDGGYIIVGSTESEELPGHHGKSDFWIVRLTAE